MKHLIKIDSTPHGVLGVRHTGRDQQYCEAGELVILEWQPDAKWGLQEAHYTDGGGNVTAIDLTRVKVDGKDVVVFTMPNKDIIIGGTFKMFVSQDWTTNDKENAGKVLGIDENGNIIPVEGGGGGTSNYPDLENKPSINGVELVGDMTSENLKIQNGYINADTVEELPTASSEYQSKIALVPSTTTIGSIDYYACEYIDNAWSWVKVGTTSPVISVQAVDATSEIHAKTYSGKCFGGGPQGTGALIDLSSSVVYEYNVTGLDKVYVSGRSWVSSSESSIRYFIGYYDENGYMAGMEANVYYPFNNTPCILTNEEITLPQGTKYIRLNVSSSYTDLAECIGEIIIGQNIVKSQATPNTFIYGTVKIDQSMPSDANSNTEITKTSVDSAFGIMFPQSYHNIGKPTQVIAMLHGSNGCVTPTAFGYEPYYTNWPVWRQQYLDAGFAVMDINGYGVSTTNDVYSKPNGNPQSVETLDKAWELIKMKYNVCDKLLLHGTSMGGANAMSYLLNHPNKVAGVALFAPEVIQHVVKLGSLSDSFKNSVAQAWSYNDAATAIADGFSKLIGYAPFMEGDFDWVNMDATSFVLLSNPTRLANVPIRIWHGTNDNNIPLNSSQMLVSCLKRANIPVTLRICEGGEHNISGGAVGYVRNEAVSWFKRFAI